MSQVKGLSNLLKTNLDKGISGDEADISRRRSAFGTNTYPQKKGRSFWVCFVLLLLTLSFLIQSSVPNITTNVHKIHIL